MDRKKGFTLIELLVVIAIIALLMSILMPALNKVSDQAKQAVCMSNLHQWAIAFKMFTDDNDGHFIENYRWMEFMHDYVKSDDNFNSDLNFCKSATKTLAEGAPYAHRAWADEGDVDGDEYYVKGSVGINQWVTLNTGGDRPVEKLWKTPNVPAASRAPMFLDTAQYSNICPNYTDQPPQFNGVPSTGNDDEMRRACIDRHNMAVNIAFLDFSVHKIRIINLWDLWWHRDWNPDNLDPPDFPDWMY
jgi:prepilin-type N-terminal cleavage/methylation domain-containing protein